MALNEDEQTEAVFKSSRTEIDPVSGNEVPPGSLPEEVRDDIPAMLSEGEYVVPADVLRYYGVKFFEDLRAQAKMGLAEMEANGRIGGEPIEEETGDVGISDEDLMVIMAQAPQEEPQQVMANRGGLIGFETGGLNYPAYIKQPDITQFGMAGPDFKTGIEYRTYVNDAGLEITIPFFDGQPMGMIPPGYTLKSDAATATEKAAPQDDDGGVGSPEDLDRPEAIDYSTYTEEELEDALEKNNTATSIATGMMAIPGIGLVGAAARAFAAAERDKIEKAMEDLGMEVEKDDSIASKIVDGVKNLVNKGKDKDKGKSPTPDKDKSPTPDKDTTPTPSSDDGPSISPTVGTTPSAASAPTADTGGGMTGSDTAPDDPRGEGQYGGSDVSVSGEASSSDTTSGGYVEDPDYGLLNEGGMMKKPKSKKNK